LGHARTFWYAAERARAAGGTLILRNDDLDAIRFQLDFVDAMIEDLRWLGFQWEEPNGFPKHPPSPLPRGP
jgi:glutamyl-tRNA synthetase